MQWNTPLNDLKAEQSIDIKDQIVSLGSCFAERVSERFTNNKFQSIANPLGIAFNPISLARQINVALGEEVYKEHRIIQRDEVYYHYDLHSKISALDKDTLNQMIDQSNSNLRNALLHSNYLIITFGTAIAYELIADQHIVSNCHKVNKSNFKKTTLTLTQMKQSMATCLTLLRERNPSIKVILTVSPVRHIKDGLTSNNLSKSLLRVLCNDLVHSLPEVHYFPSYEIMIDELRDYRFYAEDMIHPNKVAEEYIWNKFVQNWLTPSTKEIVAKWNKVSISLSHRPFHTKTIAHQTFLKKTLEQLQSLANDIDVSKEIEMIENQR